MAMDEPGSQFIRKAQEMSWGIPVDGQFISLLLFADNFWLLGESPRQLQSMAVYWRKCLQDHGWDYPVDEATWTCNFPDDYKATVTVGGIEVKRTARKEGVKILGTYLTIDNKFGVELKHRIQKAWGGFHKFQSLLRTKRASWKMRNKLLNQVAATTMFSCSGPAHCD